MKKKYAPSELLRLAVDGVYDETADLDADGRVTAADARLAGRRASGLPDGNANAPLSGKTDEGAVTMRESLYAALLDGAPGAGRDTAGVGADTSRLYDDYFRFANENAALAAKNAFGLAASRTGGYGSSWATSAATAAYNDYMKGVSDAYLELERLTQNADSIALQQEKQRMDAAYKLLGLLDDEEETAYSHAQDELQFAFDAAKAGDYSYLAALGVDASALRDRDALEAAEKKAKYGDYSGLSDLGVDVSNLIYRELLSAAGTLAGYGDYSALEDLGVDVSALYEQDLIDRALALAKYGDYSLLGTFSQNGGVFKQKISVSIQKGAEAAYAVGGRAGLVRYLDRQVGYGQLTEDGKQQILAVLAG